MKLNSVLSTKLKFANEMGRPKKKIPQSKPTEVSLAESESDDEPIAQKSAAKSPSRRAGRPKVEEKKPTRTSRSSQKENGSPKQKETSRTNGGSSNNESDNEPVNASSSRLPAKKRKATDDKESENGDTSKSSRFNPHQMFEVEEIVAHEGYGSGRLYRIRWKGYGPESDTWEPRKKLSCPKLIAKYYVKVKHSKTIPINTFHMRANKYLSLNRIPTPSEQTSKRKKYERTRRLWNDHRKN